MLTLALFGKRRKRCGLFDEPCYRLVDVKLAIERISKCWTIEMLMIVLVVEHFALFASK
jgi:hypothetical protein